MPGPGSQSAGNPWGATGVRGGCSQPAAWPRPQRRANRCSRVYLAPPPAAQPAAPAHPPAVRPLPPRLLPRVGLRRRALPCRCRRRAPLACCAPLGPRCPQALAKQLRRPPPQHGLTAPWLLSECGSDQQARGSWQARVNPRPGGARRARVSRGNAALLDRQCGVGHCNLLCKAAGGGRAGLSTWQGAAYAGEA